MGVAAAVNRSPHGFPSRVHSNRKGLRGSRYVDAGKYSVAQQKTMGIAAGIRYGIRRYRLAG
jgi:hypothetical protein